MKKVSIRDRMRNHGPHNNAKRETFFRVERVPKELMYTDFVYGEDIPIPNSEVAFDAASVVRFDALDPMNAPLVLEAAEDVLPRDHGDDFLQPTTIASGFRKDLDLPAQGLRVTGVHTKEIRCE